MYQMVPICLLATPLKRDAWGDWITTHILTHIITLPLTLHPSQSLHRVATPVHLRRKPWPLMVKKCLKARKILVRSTAVLLCWHAMLLPTNSSSYKVWIEIKYDLQIACFHATVSTVLSFTQRVPIKPYCKLGLNNFRKIGTEIRLDNMQTECGSILSSHFWGGALGDHTKNGFGAY